MEYIAKVSFELEEWIFELLLSEEEKERKRKKREKAEKLKEIERLIFILVGLIGGLPSKHVVAKKAQLIELIEKRELVRG